jgi:uncharacterized protein YerC
LKNQVEIWKFIPEFEGFYEASTFGRIRSIDRKVWTECNGGCVRTLKGVILKESINVHGYKVVKLSVYNDQITKTVHGLVVKAFLSNDLEGLEVNHKDGDKTNNHISNLEIITKSENEIHKRKMYNYISCNRIEDKDAEIVKKMKSQNATLSEIRKETGISISSISKITRNN